MGTVFCAQGVEVQKYVLNGIFYSEAVPTIVACLPVAVATVSRGETTITDWWIGSAVHHQTLR